MRLLLLAGALTTLVTAADTIPARTSPAPAPNASELHVPFQVGERLSYRAKVNFMHAGQATMSVEGIEMVRGQPTYHIIFDVDGGVLFFHAHDHYESWFDTTTLASLHHVQHIDESGHHIDRVYDFYPDRQIYVRNDTVGHSVSAPLDEGSFLYFLRTLPLVEGKTYTINRYYHLERNPIVIRVVRKEHISVPAGDYDAWLLEPVIKSKGLFSEHAQARVWLSADSNRTLLRLQSKLPIGTLYLDLDRSEYASRR